MWPTAGTGRTSTNLHLPISVSLASNVPGHEGPYNFISEGYPQRLVDNMLACLWQVPDVACGLVLGNMVPYQSHVHGTLRTLRMLRSWWTTCLPWVQELRPWLKHGGYWKVGWEVCQWPHSMVGIMTYCWSSPTWPTAMVPGNRVALLLWCLPRAPTRLALGWQWWWRWGRDVEHPKEGLMLHGPLHPNVGLLGSLQLIASRWVQLCQVSQCLHRACLRGENTLEEA